MPGLGLAELIPFFITTFICLGTVIVWMVGSEAKRNMCKIEISKLRSQVQTLEREKAALIENESFLTDNMQHGNQPDGASGNEVLMKENEELETENTKLRSEVANLRTAVNEKTSFDGYAVVEEMKGKNEALAIENRRLRAELDQVRAALDEKAASGSDTLIEDLRKKNEMMLRENKKLKIELDEVKGSLEEVYKALCQQNAK